MGNSRTALKRVGLDRKFKCDGINSRVGGKTGPWSFCRATSYSLKTKLRRRDGCFLYFRLRYTYHHVCISLMLHSFYAFIIPFPSITSSASFLRDAKSPAIVAGREKAEWLRRQQTHKAIGSTTHTFSSLIIFRSLSLSLSWCSFAVSCCVPSYPRINPFVSEAVR